MRRRPVAALGASLVLLVLATGLAVWPPAARPAHTPATAAVLDALATLPLGFEPNVGQDEVGVQYVARGPGYRLALSATEATIDLPDADAPVTMRLVGSNPAAVATGVDPLVGRTNYLTGGDPSAWRTDVPTFAKVAYDDVWPGIDLVFLGNQRRLRHDFVVAPGADPATIAVEFDSGTGSGDQPTIDPVTGDLVLGSTRLSAPVLFQDIDGKKTQVEGSFRLIGGTRVGFTVGDYDRRHPLVIDPTLVTSSYFGGSGIDNAAAVEVDGGGNVYIVGSTESPDLRLTNPVQNTRNGTGSDAFVAKLNPEGTSILFSTYLGGGSRDAAAGVAVGSDGSVYVTGVTESADFPKTSPSAQDTYNGGPSDAFVTKLVPTGASIEWSTFLGGSQTDGARGIAVSPAGEAFVTGSTNSVEFPVANPLQQTAPAPDDVDAFVTKVAADGTSFAFSSRLGGSNDDRGLDVAVDPAGNGYFTGDTRSPGFPTARPLQAAAGGSDSGVAGSFSDAFVTKVGPAGNMVYSTFLGGADTDQATSIAVDGEGAVYVTGTTNSANFPLVTPLQATKDSDTDAFVTKVNPAGSAIVYSTFLGGGGADNGAGIVVDGAGGATVAGTTGSTNFPTAKPLQGVKGGGATDAFVSTLAPAGATLVSSTYLGGRDDDQAAGIGMAPGTDTPVVVGTSTSPDFPTAKPLQPARAGTAADAFVTRISSGEAAAPVTTADPGGIAAPATGGSSTHDRRVRLLVATTAALFLIAVLQTAYLRRREAADGSQWGQEQPEPLVPPVPVQTWGGGVRVIDEKEPDGEDFFAGRETQAVAVPDLLEEDWGSPIKGPVTGPVKAPVIPPLPPAPRVPLEELSFWDLFPEDLPPSRRPGAMDDADWALEDQEDVLVGPGGQAPAPPPPPPLPPPPPAAWEDPEPPAPEPAPPVDDNLLLTELLDLSPAATREANATHYGNLIDAGGGDVFPGGDDDDEDGDDDHDEDGDGDGDGSASKAAGATKAGSGSSGTKSGTSGTKSGPPGSGSSGSGTRKPRPKRSGRRRPKPAGSSGGGTGGSGGTSGGGSSGGASSGGGSGGSGGTSGSGGGATGPGKTGGGSDTKGGGGAGNLGG